MSFTWLYLKIRKKWKPAYRKTVVELRKKLSDPEKRLELNKWYNKMNLREKSLFHRLFGRLFQGVSHTITEGEWAVDFAGKTVKMPLRNNSLWLDWDLSIAIGGHDAEVKETYENFIRNGSVKTFFDIGTNYGTHSLLFLKHGVKTISFEPIPALKKDFEFLCSINNVNGQMENVAVGDKIGIATLSIPLNETWEATIVASEVAGFADKKQVEKIEVPVITIDEYVSKNKLYPDLMKIDTEGNEIYVLKGAVKTITDHQPFIIFETNNLLQRQILWDFFKEINYKILELPYKKGMHIKEFYLEQFLQKGSTNYIALPLITK